MSLGAGICKGEKQDRTNKIACTLLWAWAQLGPACDGHEATPAGSGKALEVLSHSLLVILQIPSWANKATVGKVEERKRLLGGLAQAPGWVGRW